VATAQTATNASIQAARDEDGPARARREEAHPGVTALVVALGKREQVVHNQAHRLGVSFAVDQRLRGHAKVGQPLGRKVHPRALGILEDVPGDVGELHGDAQVDGVP
jgi:hypothetical protein